MANLALDETSRGRLLELVLAAKDFESLKRALLMALGSGQAAENSDLLTNSALTLNLSAISGASGGRGNLLSSPEHRVKLLRSTQPPHMWIRILVVRV